MLWLYLHYPQLPLDHLLRAMPSAPPLAIIEGAPATVRWVNSEARQSGIVEGASLNTACCLCPTLHTSPYDPEQEAQTLKTLASTAYRYASHISLYPPDGMLLEVSTMLKLFKGLNRLWNQLYADISNQGFTLSLATGSTPLTARLLARNGLGECSKDKEHLQTLTQQLNLYQAELPGTAAESGKRIGIKSLAELMALPSHQLARRFGSGLVHYLNRVSGKEPDPQVAYRPPSHFYRRLDFITEIEHLHGILFPLQRLLNELSDYLTETQLMSDQLSLTLYYRDQPTTHIQVRAAQPSHLAEEFIQLCRLHLESHNTVAAITAMGIKVDQFAPFHASSRELFAHDPHNRSSEEQQPAFLKLIGRLHARLGAKAISQILLAPEHRPEKAQKIHPINLKTPAASFAKHTRPAYDAETRPLWLCHPPQPLAPYNLTLLDKPERILSGWWEQDCIPRDYYRILLPDNRVGWGFRNSHGEWFLQGWFS